MPVTSDVAETIFKNKKENTTCLIKNFYKDVPSWEEFIQYIQEASHERSKFSEPLPEYDLALNGKVAGNVLIKQNFYFYVGVHKEIGVSDKIIRDFALSKINLALANLYVNLSNRIDNVKEHQDPLDNFYWQCHGSVEWSANGNKYLVEPGDLVFIPSQTKHSVNFLGPRAAIGFAGVLNV